MVAAHLYVMLFTAIAAVNALPAELYPRQSPSGSASPVLPSRNATTGQVVGSSSSANNTNAANNDRNVTINNNTITGTNGGQAACSRKIGQWCIAPNKRAPAPYLLPRQSSSAQPVLPSRNATSGQVVGSSSSANNSNAVDNNRNVTINNNTITGTNGAGAACGRKIGQWCVAPAKRAPAPYLLPRQSSSAQPVLPSRNATTGQVVGSSSSANNTNAQSNDRNVTINNNTVTGTNGAGAACSRKIGQWCVAPAKRAPAPYLLPRQSSSAAPVLPSRNATSGQRVGSGSSANNTNANTNNRNVTINNNTITGTNGASAACSRRIGQWCFKREDKREDKYKVEDHFEA